MFELAEPSFIPMDTGGGNLLVSNVSQSDTGLMWFATGGGLFHFDGYSYQEMDYSNADGASIHQQYILAIAAGVDGVMWAGTNSSGLAIVDERRRKFKLFQHDSNNPNSIASDKVNDILAAGAKDAWVATSLGLDYFDGTSSSFRHHRLSDQAGQNVRSIRRIENGDLLLGTTKGLYQYNIESQQTLPLTNNRALNLNDKQVDTITPDELGRIWIGTYHSGAYLLEADGRLRKLENYDRVLSIEVLGEEVWVATINYGIAVFDYQTGLLKRYYTHDKHRPMALDSSSVTSIFLDQSGLVWIAKWGGGLTIATPARNFSRTLFYSPSKQAPTFKDDVSNVVETNSGEIWVSSLSQGIDVFDPLNGFQRQITKSDQSILKLPSNRVKSLFKSEDGNIWISTLDAGLVRYRENARSQTATQGHANTWVGDACSFQGERDKPIAVSRYLQRSDGALLLFSNAGLFMLENPEQKLCRLTNIEFETDNTPRYGIALDEQKTLITEYSGLHVLERGETKATKIKVVVEGTEIGSEPVITGGFGMPSGRVFLSSSRDLYQVRDYSKGLIRIAKIHSSETGAWLYDEDRSGNAWGLSSYWLAQHDAVKSLQTADGLVEEAGYSVGYIRTSDELFVIVQELGLNVRKTLAFEEWRYQPPIIATDIMIDDREYRKDSASVIVEENDQGFSISFAALDYSGSQSLLYRYLLEGYSTDWVGADASSRKATFTNLAPGEYSFRVQATNRRGEWSNLELKLPVTVMPSWYQTWMFRIVITLLALMALYGLYLWRIDYYKAKKLELEGLVRDRTADLAQSMESLKNAQEKLVLSEKQAALGRLVSGVAHEINTPLGIVRMAYSTAETNVIELFQAFGINTHKDKPVHSRYKKFVTSAGLIESNLGKLSNLVNSFKQISVNEDDWSFQTFAVDELLANIMVIQEEQAKALNIEIQLEVEAGLAIYSCGEILQNVATELTSNALMHGFGINETGRVTLRAFIDAVGPSDSKYFVLQVEDDGAGVADDLLEKLFDPFTAQETSNLGLGLHVVINLVNSVLHGEITCNSEIGLGSCFTVKIPLFESTNTA